MTSVRLSARAAALRPSPTLAITGKARALKEAGEDVISLAAGEPDFNTPEAVCQAAIDSIKKGFTKYTASSGIPELKTRIVEKLKKENGISVESNQVIVSCGAKHSVYNAAMVLLEPGDEVILLAPYWMTYADQVRLAGGVPVVVSSSAESGFQPDYDRLRAAITPKTRAIIVNSPSNPTGAVYPRETIKQIAALALRHDLWVISDEIYEKLLYEGEHVSVASLGSEIADKTITIGGCSKSFAMTGWRIGFAAAPLPVAQAMSNFQDQVTSNPTSFAQKGAAVAFGLDPHEVEAMRREFQGRREMISEMLAAIPNVLLRKPGGAFYVFPDFSAYLGGKIADDVALADYLLDEAKVAAIPGSVFEGPGHLRLSYAASRSDIERGLNRITDALKRLAP